MIGAAVRRPVAVSMACLAVALLGLFALRRVPVELLPDTRLPRLIVSASWPGASPESTEAFLTSPLEAAVQQVRGVETVTSESAETGGSGTSRIEIEFARDTDMDFARLELAEAMAALRDELPTGATPPRVQQYVPREFEEQTRPFLSYTLTGPYTLESLRAHVDDEVAPQLLQLDGVADVWAAGGRRRLLEIELDEVRIRALGLGVEDVRRRVRELENVREAGVVEQAGKLYAISLRERAGSADDVRNAIVASAAGGPIRVADVARVHDTYEDAQGYNRVDGLPAVSFSVVREAGTSAVRVADAVRARVDSLAAAAPAGTRFMLNRDESTEIRRQLSDLGSRALISAAAVLLVLLLFLRSFAPAAIIFATMAFSILVTFNLLYFAGYSLNVLTLMGLAMGFGLMVDNAIVVVENIFRRMRAGEARLHAADHGTREVVMPIIAATLTNLVVLIPFVYLQGELRVFYVPLAVVVAFSQVASLLVGFTFVPSLAARLPTGTEAGQAKAKAMAKEGRGDADLSFRGSATAEESTLVRRSPPVRWHLAAYTAVLRAALRRPWIPVIASLVMLLGSYWLFDKHVNRGVVWGAWGGSDTYIQIQISQPRGEELERTDELARHFENELRKIDFVETFETQVRPQFASIRVEFPDSIENSGYPPMLKEQLSAEAIGYGGAEVRVYGYGPSFFGGGTTAPNYSIKVLGYNYEEVRDIAEGLAGRLTRFARVREVDTNSAGQWFSRDRATEIALTLDRRRLALHGLTAQSVVNEVRAAVQGQGARERIRVGDDELDFTVKLAGHREADLRALMDLQLPTVRGAVRLGDVATAAERDVLGRIVREDQQYQRFVSYEFRGPTKLGDIVRDAVVDATHLPPGYALDIDTGFRWSEEDEKQMVGVLLVAVLLVFMVAAALFESLRQPLTVLLTVPMALIGVFLVFFYTGASFTREAYVGVIMMAGIVVNNAILLVDQINRERSSGVALVDAVFQGTLLRARPILMTSATTIFGLLPLVMFSDAADANIWNALGFALIGGLLSSTVLVLVVTPGIYLLLERGKVRASVSH